MVSDYLLVNSSHVRQFFASIYGLVVRPHNCLPLRETEKMAHKSLERKCQREKLLNDESTLW